MENVAYFVICHSTVAHLQHIQVVPTSSLRSIGICCYSADDVKHGAVSTFDKLVKETTIVSGVTNLVQYNVDLLDRHNYIKHPVS